MQTNPYSPPKAAVADQPRPPASSLKAVLAGLAVDIGGTLVSGTVFGVIYAIWLASAGMKGSEIQAAASTITPYSWVWIASMLAGSFFSVLGGFVCSRMARRPDYKLGFVLGALSAALGLMSSYKSHSLLGNAALTCLTLALVLLGTKLGRVRSGAPT